MSDKNFLKCACPGCGVHISFPPDRAGELVDCPHCGTKTGLVATEAGSASQRARIKSNVIATILLFLILVAIGAGYYRFKTWQPDQPATVVLPAITNVFIPKTFQDFDEFKVGKITLKKSDLGGLVYAVGVVKNDTNRQRFGVRITLELHDAKDASLGSTSDYLAVLEPHREWQFRALLTDPRAVSTVLTRIEEQK